MYEDVDGAACAPLEGAGERLPLLALDEAYGLLDWLLEVAGGGGRHALVAGRWAKELAARTPSRE